LNWFITCSVVHHDIELATEFVRQSPVIQIKDRRGRSLEDVDRTVGDAEDRAELARNAVLIRLPWSSNPDRWEKSGIHFSNWGVISMFRYRRNSVRAAAVQS
jgi:hypothetical protein